MPDRDYYFNTDEKSVNVRKAYQLYLYKSFRSLGKDSLNATSAANAVYALETALAKASRKIEALRDPNANYHKMNLAQLQKLYYKIGWKEFLMNSSIPVIDSVIVGQPEFFVALNQELIKTPLETWKNYLAFHLLSSSASYMNRYLFSDRFNYRKKYYRGRSPKPRWKRVLDAEENAIGEALGNHLYMKIFPREIRKSDITKLWKPSVMPIGKGSCG